MKIALALTTAVLLNLASPAHAQVPPGPYPGPQPGPGYPTQGYAPQPGPGYPTPGYAPPPSPPGYGPEQWPRCDQLAQVEQATVARLQFTPPSPERAAMEQQLRDIAAARQSCW